MVFRKVMMSTYLCSVCFYICDLNQGRLPFDRKFQNFRNGDKWYGDFLGKVPENPEIVDISKANYLTKNSGNSGIKIKWNGNFHAKMFENFGITHEIVPFYGIYANSQLSSQR